MNNLLRETTQSAIITKNVTHYSLTIETNRKKKMLLCAMHNMILWGQLHLYDNNVQRIHT